MVSIESDSLWISRLQGQGVGVPTQAHSTAGHVAKHYVRNGVYCAHMDAVTMKKAGVCQ